MHLLGVWRLWNAIKKKIWGIVIVRMNLVREKGIVVIVWPIIAAAGNCLPVISPNRRSGLMTAPSSILSDW